MTSRFANCFLLGVLAGVLFLLSSVGSGAASEWNCLLSSDRQFIDIVSIWWGDTLGNAEWACNNWLSACGNGGGCTATKVTNFQHIVVYYNDSTNVSLEGLATSPYTDVIIGFLVPDDNLNLYGAGGAFDSNLQSNIQTLQKAGMNVLISVGGQTLPSSAYQSYAKNPQTVSELVAW